jgi:hypothetical protein
MDMLLVDFAEAVEDAGTPDVGGRDILKMQLDAAMRASDAGAIVHTTLPLNNQRWSDRRGDSWSGDFA